jgi:hypothetical protein
VVPARLGSPNRPPGACDRGRRGFKKQTTVAMVPVEEDAGPTRYLNMHSSPVGAAVRPFGVMRDQRDRHNHMLTAVMYGSDDGQDIGTSEADDPEPRPRIADPPRQGETAAYFAAVRHLQPATHLAGRIVFL